MAEDLKIVNPIAVRKPAPWRGPLSSQDYNDAQEKIVDSIQEQGAAINVLYNNLEKSQVVAAADVAYLRRQVDALINQQDYVERVSAHNGYLISRLVDFSDTAGITYPNGLNDDLSAMVSAKFGQATLPANGIENRFYQISARNGAVIPSPDLQVTVTSVFDKGDGEGLVNYERGGILSAGKPEWAFNGNSNARWIRRIEFPLDSKIDTVEVELTVTVPDGTSSAGNLIEIYPFPEGSVDITSLSTSANLTDSFTPVSSFTSINNANSKRYHFPTINVDRIKIRLRQRNWVEEKGKKVFYYGLEELSMKLVDYDKSWLAGAGFGKNNSFIVRIDSPNGYAFKDLYRLDAFPNFFLEDKGNRHVHLRLSTSPDYNGVFFDSDSHVLPQDGQRQISFGGQTIYAIYELNYVSTNGGSLATYPVGTTPYVEGLGLSYTLTPI
jgi:hypothetical protein